MVSKLFAIIGVDDVGDDVSKCQVTVVKWRGGAICSLFEICIFINHFVVFSIWFSLL